MISPRRSSSCNQAIKKTCDVTIVSLCESYSIGPSEDFNSYPRDVQRDEKLLKWRSGFSFLPSTEKFILKIFRPMLCEYVTKKLEGEFRPTHFRGVATVWWFIQLHSTWLCFLRQKDVQQLADKAEGKDLKLDIKIMDVLFRESDGLAMSSRNVYLSL